ncbi:Desumoylating isopeptidase 1 [Schistosoma japonicum]|nr:Desumoylating isopeptidase 1 [Schistosoma japonicum]
MSDVFLYIYDLSGGLASIFSPGLLGKQVDGIWHTATVLYNKEFFFGQSGIQYCQPCTTSLGNPLKKQFMGQTSLSEKEIFDYLEQLSSTLFNEHLIFHLTAKHIPSYILNLPNEVLSTSFGASLGSALNVLSVGINSKTHLKSIKEPTSNTNEHTYANIIKSFRPIFFDEPLSSELLPHRVYLLWPANENSSLPTLASQLSQALPLNELITGDQCRAACELFRLAIWKDPNILMNLFTDPRRLLHKLSSVKLPYVKPFEFYDIEASRAKVLCNCLGLSSSWPIMHDPDMKLDINSIIQISLTLLNHDVENHLSKEMIESTSPSAVLLPSCVPQLLPEHKLVGLALAHNVSLYPTLNENEALELGTIYLIRTIYFLAVRFSTIADLAKCYDIETFLHDIMNENNCTRNDNLLQSSSSSVDSSSVLNDKNQQQHHQNKLSQPSEKITRGIETDSLTTIDYLIASKLLNFLSNYHELNDTTTTNL